MKRGIDVSSHNGKLDWSKLKSQGVEFAIIRIGYGGDIKSQDDKYAVYNMEECVRLGIPYGVYLYSYALNNSSVDSEIKHTLRMIEGFNPELGVYYDMEDADGYKNRAGINVYTAKKMLTGFCTKFCKAIEDAGYKAGTYANLDYFRNVLDINELSNWLIWLAQWKVKQPAIGCDMWQYTSDGAFEGVDGRFDMNCLYTEVKSEPVKPAQPDKKSNEQIAKEVLLGKWGNGQERKDRLTQADYNYDAVQAIVNDMMDVNDESIIHEVKAGDTLTKLAMKYNTTVDSIVELNNIKNKDLIYIGDLLKIK